MGRTGTWQPDTWWLVQCEGHCESGYHVAQRLNGEWITDEYDDITEYVTGYFQITP